MVDYKFVPVSARLYTVLGQMKASMHFKSFDELLAFLVSKPKHESLLGSAKWLKEFKRDEEDRVF